MSWASKAPGPPAALVQLMRVAVRFILFAGVTATRTAEGTVVETERGSVTVPLSLPAEHDIAREWADHGVRL